jgi:hypothetical protein
MKREAVADRIVTYCDTLVAFSLVNGFAFLVALAESDIRCSIANIAGVIAAINICVPIAVTLLLHWLGGYERRLRADAVEDELISGFWRTVGVFRLVLVWFFAAIVLLGIWAATMDASCRVPIG